MKKVLVLCKGNSCRSQMAEGYLQFYGKGNGLFFSAGLENHGINPYAVQVMAEDSIDIGRGTSKGIDLFRGEHFDFVINICEELTNQDFDMVTADKWLHLNIPDPAAVVGSEAQQIKAFRQVREAIKMHMLKFIGKELTPAEEPAF